MLGRRNGRRRRKKGRRYTGRLFSARVVGSIYWVQADQGCCVLVDAS